MGRKTSRSDASPLHSTDAMDGSDPTSWPAVAEATGEVQTPEDVQRGRRHARTLAQRW